MSKVWFVTGAARGIGKEIAKAALDSGAKVVATGRNVDVLNQAFGTSDNLLTTLVDVSDESQVQEAVQAAMNRFGRIDILVNNAGYGHIGVFEETSMEEIRNQFATNVFGLMAVTHAVAPIMRKQRSGHIINISSGVGWKGFFGVSSYSATKFAVQGFSESIAQELAPFGVHVTCVSPGSFRTDFLDPTSIKYSKNTKSIEDYAKPMQDLTTSYENRNQKQLGDPVKLGSLIVKLSQLENPPVTFLAGSDVVGLESINMLASLINFAANFSTPKPSSYFDSAHTSIIAHNWVVFDQIHCL